MPSLPPPGNDPLDPFALLTCDGCGRDAFVLRPARWDNITMLLCDTCYGDGEADTPTAPTLPALPTVQWHEGLPANELPGCEPCPEPGTYCAASYLAYLEQSGVSVVPAGYPVLCGAHWRAVLDDAVEQFPSLTCQPWKVPSIGRILAGSYIRVAEHIAARIAARLEHR